MRHWIWLLLIAVSLSAEEIIIDCLQGIEFLGHWEYARNTCPEDLRCVVAKEVLLLQKNPAFLKELQEEYLGAPLTSERVETLKKEVAAFYRSKNHPLVVISIPRQHCANGVLQVVVEEAKLGNVTVRGNCYFPSRWFAETIRTYPGEAIDGQKIWEDVAWLNLSPFRRTDAIYKPGAQPNVVDLELVTVDRWPYRFYAGGDNTGTVATDRNRCFFGFNFGKSILKDGQISYQFTFAPNWNLYYSHSASARLPLPWRHEWVLWGGYASVKPETELALVGNEGISWQFDTRYRFPFFYGTSLMQTFVVGYDLKETNNDLLFGGYEIFDATADINQFMLGYELGYRQKDLRVAFTGELYYNPGGITHANQTKIYEELRYGAEDKYAYLKLTHSLSAKSRLGWFSYTMTGQISSTNLLPSEQVTMTGYNAVRGFEERILNLDNAFLLNVTYETPHWSFAKLFGACKRWDEFYLLGFFDCGMGDNHQPDPSEDEDSFRHLGSVGPGVRWQFDRYLTARFDYGFQLWHSGFLNPSDSRYNFGVMLSY